MADQKQERTWAMLCHLCALVGFLGFLRIPFGNILGPLVVWLVKKNEFPSVDQEGKASLNFQITMTIIGAVAAALCFVGIGFFLLMPLVLFDAIVVILASVKISNGEPYKYPFTIQLIK